MSTIAWLATLSFVWGGVLCIAALLLQRNANLSGRMRQRIWRGALLLLIAPWIAAPVVSLLGMGLAQPETVAAPAPADVAPQVTAAMVADVGETGAAPAWIVREDIGLIPRDSSWVDIILAAVMLGWVLRFVLAQWSARRLMGIVANSEPAGKGPAREALVSWSGRLRLRRQPELRFASGNVSPFSYGILRPVIVLPEGLERRLDARALDLVVGHECLHVARGDGWLRPLERVVADVMWFNPFAWLMRREADVARELAVDEGVVVISDARRAYARALRDVAGLAVGLPVSLPAASMSLAGSGKSLVLRMRRTLGLAKRKPARVAVLAAMVLGAAGACTSVGQAMLATPAKPHARVDTATAAPQLAPRARVNAVYEPNDQTPVAPVAPQAPKAAELRIEGATYPVLIGEAKVISAFGNRTDEFSGRTEFHEGIDLSQYWGAPVFAPVKGKVAYAGTRGMYGRVVEIVTADGYTLRFGHLNSIVVKTDDTVTPGEKLGSMGSTGRGTGPHLHFEVAYKGKTYDPLTVQGLTLSATGPSQAAPQPVPSATPIMFQQEQATPRPQSGGKDLPAPMYSPMKMRVVSVEPDASGMTVALESLVTEGVNKGCKFRTTAMTDVKVRTGEAIEQGDLVGTRNTNSDQYVNCGMMFAQLMLSQGDPSWAATQQAIEASKKAVDASQKAVGAAKIPATPVTPAAPAAPSTPASPTSYTPQPDAEFWQQLHRGVSVDTNLVRTRYRQGARPEIRAPFGARVIQAKQVSDKTGVVVLQQVGPGQGYPLTASSRRCDMSIVLSLVRVSVGQTLAEGDLVGEAQLGNTGRAWSCDGVTIADGPAERPPKLEGATHAVVASPAQLTSGFGIRLDPFDSGNSALHPGMDIGKELGAAIYAPVGATVWRAENDPDLGNVVVLGVDGGYTFRFARLQEIKVKRGDTVKAGDILGTMGSTGPSTGPHLHFEAFWNGRAYNPAVVPGLTLIGPQ